ncbi:MAG: ABC transporter ATP-binding protein [Proteobacteria bacterium]|nr:ABC transporter ATP-binding protein [Pseudomonadota bacterium]
MLSVHQLSVRFTSYETGLKKKETLVTSDLELAVEKGQVVAVAGSSGSGKSLLAHAILGILPGNARVSGEIMFKGTPVTPKRQIKIRGKEMALIPQSIGCLDPLMRIGKQITRAGILSGIEKNKVRVTNILRRYGLPDHTANMFPFQLSGGMARRVLLATATVGKADLIIADEPIHGLHEEVASDILSHLRELADQGKAILLITHDLSRSLLIADKVVVFYAGTTVEEASATAFSGEGKNLHHPYSRALWQALPQNGFFPVSGTQPVLDHLPEGCVFAPRCDKTKFICKIKRPPVMPTDGGFVRCFHA